MRTRCPPAARRPRPARRAPPTARSLARPFGVELPDGPEVLDLRSALERALDPVCDSAGRTMAWNDRTMVLSDRSIREALAAGRITIDPFDDELVQPSSVDVRCDHRFRVFHPGRYPYIDVKQAMPDLTELVEIDDGRAFILHPGEFVLGATLERISLPDDLVARLDGKSSLGRLGRRCTRPPGSPTPASPGRSRWSCPT